MKKVINREADYVTITLASLEMPNGPFEFDDETIESEVEEDKLGNYALGYESESDKGVIPIYVGRSDTDLRRELKASLSTKSQTRKIFKFCYSASAKLAFEKECKNYHDFRKQLENEIHSRRPEGTKYRCPVTTCKELDDS
jgi:hypothetical protein